MTADIVIDEDGVSIASAAIQGVDVSHTGKFRNGRHVSIASAAIQGVDLRKGSQVFAMKTQFPSPLRRFSESTGGIVRRAGDMRGNVSIASAAIQGVDVFLLGDGDKAVS